MAMGNESWNYRKELRNMLIYKTILDNLTRLAMENPRLRQAMDLRNPSEDLSMWMFNVFFTGTKEQRF